MRPCYNYDDDSASGFSTAFRSGWTNTVKALIVVNSLALLVVFALRNSYPDIYQWVGFHLPNLLRGAFWQPISYMFVHGSLWHLLMNMLGLYFFAGDVERRLGRVPFLVMYFLCGVAGALLSLMQPAATVIGASGGVLGVLVAYAALFPDVRVLVFLIIPVRARYLAIFYAFITVASLLGAPSGNVAHWAHLGGMAVGFLFVKASPIATKLRDLWHVKRARWEANRSDAENSELDRVLEKVHREGITALSNQERDFLTLMSRRRR